MQWSQYRLSLTLNHPSYLRLFVWENVEKWSFRDKLTRNPLAYNSSLRTVLWVSAQHWQHTHIVHVTLQKAQTRKCVCMYYTHCNSLNKLCEWWNRRITSNPRKDKRVFLANQVALISSEGSLRTIFKRVHFQLQHFHELHWIQRGWWWDIHDGTQHDDDKTAFRALSLDGGEWTRRGIDWNMEYTSRSLWNNRGGPRRGVLSLFSLNEDLDCVNRQGEVKDAYHSGRVVWPIDYDKD